MNEKMDVNYDAPRCLHCWSWNVMVISEKIVVRIIDNYPRRDILEFDQKIFKCFLCGKASSIKRIRNEEEEE